MHLFDDKLILSPSDLSNSLACDHLLALELEVANGKQSKAKTDDPATELLRKRGDEHEQAYLQSLQNAGKSVITVSVSDNNGDALQQAEQATLEAMRSGADVIYQATFFDGRWRGHADFLEKCDVSSDLGDFSYEVVDTKLAHHAKVAAILQTSNYSEHVARLQGAYPANMHLQLGDGSRASFPTRDFDAYYRTMKRRFEELIDNGIDTSVTYPEPISHCTICDWADACATKREEDDHLSFIAGMGKSQRTRLKQIGIVTTAEFAANTAATIPGIGSRTLHRLREQARLQIQQRESNEVSYELLEPENPRLGFGQLPEPSPGDLFFDMEGDPYVGTHGIEYLFGVTQEIKGERVFKTFWAHNAEAEKKAFENFIDFVMSERKKDPNLHIYHYANYEQAAMKKLAARYDTRESEVDELLRGEVFVDLYRIVKQSLRISQPSYSIKKLEPFYMEARETEVVGGAQSIVAYETWLETGEQKILDEIEEYNNDDCDSTLLLRNWLEERRTEAISLFGDIPRPAPQDDKPSQELSELEQRIRILEKAIFNGVVDDNSTDDDKARWLLSQLLEWHRREDKADWWRHYELRKMSEADLYEDRDALAGLEYRGVVEQVKHSLVHEYKFDPAQDHKLKVGARPLDYATLQSAGEVTYVNNDKGVIRIKRSKQFDASTVTALIPPGPRPNKAQQQALLEIGEWVAENGLSRHPGLSRHLGLSSHPGEGRGPVLPTDELSNDDEGNHRPFQCGIDLLMRRTPRLQSNTPISSVLQSAESASVATCEIAKQLDHSTLAVQGPPGSGKTYTGADVVLELVAQGKKVGITATSHKVIGNLLEEISKHAREKQQLVRILQKASEDDRCSAPDVKCAAKNEEVENALRNDEVDVVGGTAWLFASEVMRQAVDVLIIDEAGQFSLANALAVSTSAESMILLGDPQQLAQPEKGVHPDGAGASALAHLLGEHQTIPEDLGVLLDQTWRMHPDVCDFVSEAFYDSLLKSVDDCSNQTIEGDDELSGTGLRFINVEHSGNKTSSTEEAKVTADSIARVIGRKWTDREGNTDNITLDDVLVVAPYNAQVALLKQTLPEGARVGTVDKFQGQEAPIVFYSLAASSPDDISRGMEFLYSTNRLNVAVSRAKCLAVIVANKSLLVIAARSPEQARLANALCGAAEVAKPIS